MNNTVIAVSAYQEIIIFQSCVSHIVSKREVPRDSNPTHSGEIQSLKQLFRQSGEDSRKMCNQKKSNNNKLRIKGSYIQ